jgi:hypothetical protein
MLPLLRQWGDVECVPVHSRTYVCSCCPYYMLSPVTCMDRICQPSTLVFISSVPHCRGDMSFNKQSSCMLYFWMHDTFGCDSSKVCVAEQMLWLPQKLR